jgi:hypothetical protein
MCRPTLLRRDNNKLVATARTDSDDEVTTKALYCYYYTLYITITLYFIFHSPYISKLVATTLKIQ